jgi:predicted acyltransferase
VTSEDDAVLATRPAPAVTPKPAPPDAARLASLDQYRGYTVAGMFVVNFLGGLAAVHPVLKHNNNYFSYADSIMPGFLFAAGMSFRLTLLRRLDKDGPARAYRRAIGRSLALIAVSLALFGLGASFGGWAQMTAGGIWEFAARLFTAHFWEVLAIIGVTLVLILPVAARGPGVRVATAAAFLAVHAVLSHSFNYEFVYGRPNWFDAYWGAVTTRAWDGGLFGVFPWSVPVLGGTLAYDIVAAGEARAVRRLVGWGAGLMALAYLVSCLATPYDADATTASPVVPPLPITARPATSFLADPPFVHPPEGRPLNYWVMDKRVVTPSFILFGTGFAFALYGLFVLACDAGGWGLDAFRVLGQNPLAAYLLHHPVRKTVLALVPKDAPLWWCLVGLAAYLVLMMWFLRFLDRHKLYLRL